MFGWVSGSLENMLWFSFLLFLQWFCHLCFLQSQHLQLQHKLSGNRSLCAQFHEVLSVTGVVRNALSSLRLTGHFLCITEGYQDMTEWDAVHRENGTAVSILLLLFLQSMSVWIVCRTAFSLCLLEIFALMIRKNFLPSPFLSQFTSQIAHTKIGHKAPRRSSYSNNFICHVPSPEEVIPVPCQ